MVVGGDSWLASEGLATIWFFCSNYVFVRMDYMEIRTGWDSRFCNPGCINLICSGSKLDVVRNLDGDIVDQAKCYGSNRGRNQFVVTP